MGIRNHPLVLMKTGNSPAHNPSWGFGTGTYQKHLPHIQILITPHGDSESRVEGRRVNQGISHNSSWGFGTISFMLSIATM